MQLEEAIADFWTRHVTIAAPYPRTPREIAHLCETAPRTLPESFVALTTRALVARIDAPALRVGAVGDWLAHALERAAALRALADAHQNPVLETMVPFGDTPAGLELALDLRDRSVRVVWLDPTRYDAGPDAIAAVVAENFDAFVRSGLRGDARSATR